MQLLSEKTTVQQNSKCVNDMALDEFIRWLCLIQAIEVVSARAEQLNIDFNRCLSIKPNTVNVYITEIFPSVRANFMLENNIKFQ